MCQRYDPTSCDTTVWHVDICSHPASVACEAHILVSAIGSYGLELVIMHNQAVAVSLASWLLLLMCLNSSI